MQRSIFDELRGKVIKHLRLEYLIYCLESKTKEKTENTENQISKQTKRRYGYDFLCLIVNEFDKDTSTQGNWIRGRNGCLPFSKNIRLFRLKVKWNSNFPENPFGNCRLPPEVILFSRSEQNGGNFLTICKTFQLPVSHQAKTITENLIANGNAISFGWFADFGKTLIIIQRSSQPVYSDKW